MFFVGGGFRGIFNIDALTRQEYLLHIQLGSALCQSFSTQLGTILQSLSMFTQKASGILTVTLYVNLSQGFSSTFNFQDILGPQPFSSTLQDLKNDKKFHDFPVGTGNQANAKNRLSRDV